MVDAKGNHLENAKAVFPVGEADGEGDVDDVLCAPCEGEEE